MEVASKVVVLGGFPPEASHLILPKGYRRPHASSASGINALFFGELGRGTCSPRLFLGDFHGAIAFGVGEREDRIGRGGVAHEARGFGALMMLFAPVQ
jgi:hypothetical protein